MTELTYQDRKRLLHSSLGSLGLWAAFLVVIALVPLERSDIKTPDFPVVSITLSPPSYPEAVSRSEQSPAPEPAAPSPSAPTAPAAPAVSPPRPTARQPTSPARGGQTVKPATSSSEGLGIPDFPQPVISSNNTVGEAEFLDFSSSRTSDRPTQTTAPPRGNPSAELEGSAALVGTEQDGPVRSDASSARKSTAASAATGEALSQIAGARTVVASGETAAPASRESGSAGERTSTLGGISFEGGTRRLISPVRAEIHLPDNLARQIDSDRTITVQFTVRADGSVPGSLVIFTPSALLPPDVREWLRNEFARWRFESGLQDGQARFSYSIKVQ